MTAPATMYPDAIVVCGPIDLAEDQVRAPTLVVEVLSRSTEDHDRGAKWVAYRDLESLRPYLLVAQDARRVEVYSREAKRWSLQVLYAAAGEARERSGDAHLVFERSAYTAAARHPLAALGMAVVAAGALAFAGGLMRRRTRAR